MTFQASLGSSSLKMKFTDRKKRSIDEDESNFFVVYAHSAAPLDRKVIWLLCPRRGKISGLVAFSGLTEEKKRNL